MMIEGDTSPRTGVFSCFPLYILYIWNRGGEGRSELGLAGLYNRAALDLINTNINKVLYKRHKDKLLQRYKDIMKKK